MYNNVSSCRDTFTINIGCIFYQYIAYVYPRARCTLVAISIHYILTSSVPYSYTEECLFGEFLNSCNVHSSTLPFSLTPSLSLSLSLSCYLLSIFALSIISNYLNQSAFNLSFNVLACWFVFVFFSVFLFAVTYCGELQGDVHY